MATRLSLLWDFHILPSAVSQDLGAVNPFWALPSLAYFFAHLHWQRCTTMTCCALAGPLIGSPLCSPLRISHRAARPRPSSVRTCFNAQSCFSGFRVHSRVTLRPALVGAEICRILRDIKASALQKLLPSTTLMEEIEERCWRLELSDSLLCATSNSLEKVGVVRTINTVLDILLNARPAAR